MTDAQLYTKAILGDLADDLLKLFPEWPKHQGPLVVELDQKKIRDLNVPKMKLTIRIDFEGLK